MKKFFVILFVFFLISCSGQEFEIPSDAPVNAPFNFLPPSDPLQQTPPSDSKSIYSEDDYMFIQLKRSDNPNALKSNYIEIALSNGLLIKLQDHKSCVRVNKRFQILQINYKPGKIEDSQNAPVFLSSTFIICSKEACHGSDLSFTIEDLYLDTKFERDHSLSCNKKYD